MGFRFNNMIAYWRPKAVPAQSVTEELANDILRLITTIKLGSLEAWYAQPAIRFLHSFGTTYQDLNRQQIISELHRLEKFWDGKTGRSMRIVGEDDE